MQLPNLFQIAAKSMQNMYLYIKCIQIRCKKGAGTKMNKCLVGLIPLEIDDNSFLLFLICKMCKNYNFDSEM